MAYEIVDEKTGHAWDKVNLVTKFDSSGSYDVWQCVNCKKKFKRRGVSWHPLETLCKPKRRPTKRALDDGDSAASQALSPQSGESTPEVNLAAQNSRKGMCSRCALSEPKENGHLWCTKYLSHCMSVARNCPGPVERLPAPRAADGATVAEN